MLKLHGSGQQLTLCIPGQSSNSSALCMTRCRKVFAECRTLSTEQEALHTVSARLQFGTAKVT